MRRHQLGCIDEPHRHEVLRATPRRAAAVLRVRETSLWFRLRSPELAEDFERLSGHVRRPRDLAEKFGEQNLFVGPQRAQATTQHFRWPELVAVTDLATARQAVDTILEQGEGARGHWQQAHFGQFVQILDEYREMLRPTPSSIRSAR